MSTTRLATKTHYCAHRTAARASVWLILLCLAAGSSAPAAGRAAAKSSDSVFCPLQAAWVEKHVPRGKAEQPLAEICASGRGKSQFLFELSARVPLPRLALNSRDAEKLFFDYLGKGKRTFAEISSPQNSPEREPAKLTGERKAASGVYKTNFDDARAEVFTLTQAARPPTVQEPVLFEPRVLPRPLKKISRRVRPRAPPRSL